MVIAATSDSKVLQNLLHAYWGPIYAYIRRTGASKDEAADLAQEFVAQIVLERKLIERADPERGRFRTFLKSALRNFLIDQHRRSTARGRSPPKPPLTGLTLEELEPSQNDEPASAFDRQWAATILSLALQRTEHSCLSAGQHIHWAAFKAAIIDPALGHSTQPSLQEVAQRLNIDDAEHASSMVQTVRRKFKRALREVVEDTLHDPTLADDELSDLKRFLGV
jgi:RNA polymerase sigma factor (sigma-70 family)